MGSDRTNSTVLYQNSGQPDILSATQCSHSVASLRHKYQTNEAKRLFTKKTKLLSKCVAII